MTTNTPKTFDIAWDFMMEIRLLTQECRGDKWTVPGFPTGYEHALWTRIIPDSYVEGIGVYRLEAPQIMALYGALNPNAIPKLLHDDLRRRGVSAPNSHPEALPWHMDPDIADDTRAERRAVQNKLGLMLNLRQEVWAYQTALFNIKCRKSRDAFRAYMSEINAANREREDEEWNALSAEDQKKRLQQSRERIAQNQAFIDHWMNATDIVRLNQVERMQKEIADELEWIERRFPKDAAE